MINRREFVRDAAAIAGAFALTGSMDAQMPTKRLPQVRLGKTGLRASLLGMGTGTVGVGHASNQTRLGQDRFTAIVQHAFAKGITFFDCADQYGSNPYLGRALKTIGIPRKNVVIQTKTNSRTADAVRADVERFLNELQTDYIDIVLLHCMMQDDWNTQLRGAMDALEALKKQGKIRAHGVSCHTFGALQTAAGEPWVDVDLARFNPWGRMMDQPPGEDSAATRVGRVREVLQKMKQAGKGVIGMKVVAEGRMVRGDDRLERIYESVKFSLESSVVDLMVVGVESEQQVDELVEQTFRALEAVKKRA